MKKDNTPVDIDFAEAAVPHYARRGIVTMFMIMLGFTFFSASMWVGQEMADGLDFGGFITSMIIGGIILMVPGVAFTNAIRDMADSDYISGSVRMLDAIISFFCIAIGVGVVLALYGNIAGAPLLP